MSIIKEESITTFKPDSYCGLYCGACEIQYLYKKSLEMGTEATWDDLPPALKDNIPKTKVECCGCTTDVLSAGCRRCAVRQCAREREIAACVVCPEYECELVKTKIANVAKIKDVLPHTKIFYKEVDMIKEKGIEFWIREKERRWGCLECGTPFTWYQEKCEKCGADVSKLKEHDRY